MTKRDKKSTRMQVNLVLQKYLFTQSNQFILKGFTNLMSEQRKPCIQEQCKENEQGPVSSMKLVESSKTNENSASSPTTVQPRRYSAAETTRPQNRKMSDLVSPFLLPRGSFDLDSSSSSIVEIPDDDMNRLSTLGPVQPEMRSIHDVSFYISRRGSRVSFTQPTLPAQPLMKVSTALGARRRSVSSRGNSPLRLTPGIDSPNSPFEDNQGLDVRQPLKKQLTQMKQRADLGLFYLMESRASEGAAVASNKLYSPDNPDRQSISSRQQAVKTGTVTHSSSWPPSIFGMHMVLTRYSQFARISFIKD
jgi:hypothetical protein